MNKREYRLNAGQYVYHVDGEPTTRPADTIALAFDSAEGTLQKHGDPELVSRWYTTNRKKLIDAGCAEWAANMVVVEGRFPLEEINRCLSEISYGSRFLEKLHKGEISPIPFGPIPPIALARRNPPKMSP